MFNGIVDVAKIMREIKARVVKETEDKRQTDVFDQVETGDWINQLHQSNAELERIASFVDHSREQIITHPIGADLPRYERFIWPIRSIFRLISKVVRKSIKFVIHDQEEVNNQTTAISKALKERQDVILNRQDILTKATKQIEQKTQTNNDQIQEMNRKMIQMTDQIPETSKKIIQLTNQISNLETEHKEALQKQDSWVHDFEEKQMELLHSQEARIKNLEEKNEIGFQKQDKRIVQLEENNTTLRSQIESDRKDMGAMAREIMLAKWKIIDHLRMETEKEDDILTCNICGNSHKRSDYTTMESECIFNGGPLIRYVCPECGVVFGPSKFIDQGQKGIDEDYWVHYLGFEEGDSSYKEEKAFRLLDPDKRKIYLNYGCGKWSHTLQKLRNEGYNVFGYEPYAPETDNPYMITDKEKLKLMRFDGIFSNDVLEHFVDPVAEMQFMKSLLLDEQSRMAHCTACYSYKYEYTRFHTHFFLGDSVNIMAEKAGLEIVAFIDDMKDHDFLCYIYAPKEVNRSVIHNMYPGKGGSFVDGRIHLPKEAIAYGPYLSIPEGLYQIVISLRQKKKAQEIIATYNITAQKGTVVLSSGKLINGQNELVLNNTQYAQDIEIVIHAEEELTIEDIEIYRKPSV